MKKVFFFAVLIGLLSINLFSTSIGWGNLQWPFSISIVQNDTTENIYGQVWMSGVTDSPGQGAGITAELGYGADGSTPDGTWTWFTATYFGDSGSNDEYVYNLVCSMAPGNYDYTYRYQYTGDSDYYYAGTSGDLTVNAAPQPTYDVTFQVDMQNQTVSGDGVHIAGSFQGWDPSATALTDPDLDDIYTVTVALEAATYQFKYVNGNSWGQDESVPGECATGGNRSVTTPAADTTLAVVCYGECGACTPLTNQDVTVTFQVYMGNLDPGWYENGVSVQGSTAPLDWDAGSTLLTDPDLDLVYTGDVLFPSGTFPDVEYKFTRKDADSLWSWETCNNRPFTIDDGGSFQYLEMNYWDDVVPAPQNVTSTVVGDDIQVSWDAVFGPIYYDVYRSTDPYGDFGTPINASPIFGTSYTDTDAALQNIYFYQVKAFTE